MNRTLLPALAILLLSSYTLALEYSPYSDLNLQGNLNDNPAALDGDGRLLFVFTNTSSTGSFVTFNSTLLLFSSGILLWGIAGGLILYYLLTSPSYDSGYGYSGYDDYGSGYSRRFRGSYNPYAIDWEKFSIIDWLSIGEEAYRKFDPADLDCQKRLICEIHQNTDRFGAAAAKMVDLFSYLQYAEVLSLPDEFKALVEEYLDAADRGKSLQKECGEVYNACEFSVKKMVDKLNHNEI